MACTRFRSIALACMFAAAPALAPASPLSNPPFDPSNFVDVIDNPYYPLDPGTTFFYTSQTPDGTETEVFAVTHHTRVILGVTVVEVRDKVFLDGTIIEDTFDWFAQDGDGNVWYLGELATQFEGGVPVGHEGSWEAGVNGAQAGIVMEAHPRQGDRYRQEFSPGIAEDEARVVSLNRTASVPYGTFDHCLETRDTTPLDPMSAERKFYSAGVGLVLEVDSAGHVRNELTGISHADDDGDDDD